MVSCVLVPLFYHLVRPSEIGQSLISQEEQTGERDHLLTTPSQTRTETKPATSDPSENEGEVRSKEKLCQDNGRWDGMSGRDFIVQEWVEGGEQQIKQWRHVWEWGEKHWPQKYLTFVRFPGREHSRMEWDD